MNPSDILTNYSCRLKNLTANENINVEYKHYQRYDNLRRNSSSILGQASGIIYESLLPELEEEYQRTRFSAQAGTGYTYFNGGSGTTWCR